MTTAFDESERRIWAGRAEAYAGGFARLCAYTVPAVLDAVRVSAGDRVLDVGTGPGSVAAQACARGARVVAVDADPGMAEMARRAVPEAEVRVGALPELPIEDGEFDAVVGNFVLNHVGRPVAALRELRRVTRPGGRVAVTIWPVPAEAGQALLGRAVAAAGVGRPEGFPPLAAEDDFPRTQEGLAGLLRTAGLAEAACERVSWVHRADPEEWWAGPASGVAFIGQAVVSQGLAKTAEIRQHYDRLRAEFTGPGGMLALPHAALLATGVATGVREEPTAPH